MIPRQTGRLACAAAICIPMLARAESGAGAGAFAVSLAYVAAANCPDARDFKDIVIRRLGYDPFRDGAPDRVLVRIMTLGRTVQGRVEWRDARGNWAGDRTFPFRGDDCRELARAMGFALAVQIQLLAITSAPAASSPAGELDVNALTPTEGRRPAEAPPPLPPVTPSSELRNVPGVTSAAGAPPRRPRPTFAIGAGASAGFGLSSGATWLGRLSGNLAWPRLSLELAAEVGLPATTRRADGAGFSQQELLLSAAACRVLQWWSACLLTKAGGIWATGENIDVPASGSGPVVATGLRLAVTQPLGRRAYLSARVDGLVILTRWTVTLDGVPVWTAPRIAETIGLDAGVRFP